MATPQPETLAAHIRVEPVSGRQKLCEAPEWWYHIQPVLGVFALLAIAVLIADVLSWIDLIVAFVLVSAGVGSVNRQWSRLSRWSVKKPCSGGAAVIRLPHGTENNRITIRGTEQQIQDISGAPCTSFVPFIARTGQRDFRAARASRDMHGYDWVVVGVILVCGTTWIALGLSYRLLIGALLATGAIGHAMHLLRGPYVRIQPGRLELLKAKWFKSDWTVEKNIPLGDAHITADLDKGWLEIVRGEDRFVINLWEVERPMRLVTYACVAAMTPEVVLSGCHTPIHARGADVSSDKASS